MRYLLSFASLLLIMFISLPAWAQQQTKDYHEGWDYRFDHDTATVDDVEFTTDDDALHFVSDASGAAIYYKPEMKASGSFSLQADFTQNEKTAHPEAYGLFIGGNHLQEENQQYLYFLIHQDGQFLIKHRVGSETETIVDWRDSDAVQPVEDTQPTTNNLRIESKGNTVSFLVNGSQVEQIATSKLPNIDGMVGLRINHHLDVKVENFELSE